MFMSSVDPLSLLSALTMPMEGNRKGEFYSRRRCFAKINNCLKAFRMY